MVCPKTNEPLPLILLLLSRNDWEWVCEQKSGLSNHVAACSSEAWIQLSPAQTPRAVCLLGAGVHEWWSKCVIAVAWQICYVTWEETCLPDLMLMGNLRVEAAARQRSVQEVWFLVKARLPGVPWLLLRKFALDYKSKKFNHMFKAKPGALRVSPVFSAFAHFSSELLWWSRWRKHSGKWGA